MEKKSQVTADQPSLAKRKFSGNYMNHQVAKKMCQFGGALAFFAERII
jgi:hypothetical protein